MIMEAAEAEREAARVSYLALSTKDRLGVYAKADMAEQDEMDAQEGRR